MGISDYLVSDFIINAPDTIASELNNPSSKTASVVKASVIEVIKTTDAITDTGER